MEAANLVSRLARLVEGRRVVVLAGVLAGATARVSRLRQMGTERILVLAAGTGTGPLPAPEDADWVVHEVTAPDIIAGVRASRALFADPPPEMVEAVGRYDPAGDALVLGGPGPDSDGGLGARRCYGGRPAEWVALEDKVVVDGLWDDFGVHRAPSEVVQASLDDLAAAAQRLDRGLGTAWAGDAREGFNGGAVYLRWVRSLDQAAEAAAFFGAHCDRVRILPFLEGVPASIHGVVLPDGTAAMRPVEMITLRRPGQSRLLYGGFATFYDPEPPVREEMRELARTVGEGLRRRVGYRGGFTVDGVVTDDGFLPTELNPRLGALGAILRGSDLPVDLLQCALVEAEDLGLGTQDLEDLVLSAADAQRAGGAATVTESSPPAGTTEEVSVMLDDLGCRLPEVGEVPTATISFGPGQVGGFVRAQFDPDGTPKGPSVAARAVRALAFADTTFGTGIGALEACRPPRS